MEASCHQELNRLRNFGLTLISHLSTLEDSVQLDTLRNQFQTIPNITCDDVETIHWSRLYVLGYSWQGFEELSENGRQLSVTLFVLDDFIMHEFCINKEW